MVRPAALRTTAPVSVSVSVATPTAVRAAPKLVAVSEPDTRFIRASSPSVGGSTPTPIAVDPALQSSLTAQLESARHLSPRIAAKTAVERPAGGSPFQRPLSAEAKAVAPAIRWLRPDLPDPAAMNKDAGAGKIEARGQLFVDGVSPNDVQQGAIGDCYFMSSMASIAKTDPQAIKDAIRDNGNGTYTIRFFNKDGKAEYVDVDSQLYGSKGLLGDSPTYGRSTTKGELWPAIMEKAYAQWKGGYEAIGQGGSAPDAIRAITGKSSTVTPTQGTSTDDLWRTIQSGENANVPMVASTYGEGKKKYDDSGVYGSHVYSVLGTEQRDGQRYVVLRNPWGNSEYANPGYQTDVDTNYDGKLDGNDGTFRMKVEDFARYYRDVVVSR